MTGTAAPISKLVSATEYRFVFSICTLVTRIDEYNEMLRSFVEKGFDRGSCEFLYIDNVKTTTYDAYNGLNLFLSQARGEYIIICHQDILLQKDGRAELENLLQKLETHDKNWAVCGNAGASGLNHIIYHISYPNGEHLSKGRFPQQVNVLDENFLVIKSNARLSLSHDMPGFHLYGTDLCLLAELRGYSAYVIAFRLLHKSRGNLKSIEFAESKNELVKKYNRFFRSRWLQTTATRFYLSGATIPIGDNPLNVFFRRMINGFRKKL